MTSCSIEFCPSDFGLVFLPHGGQPAVGSTEGGCRRPDPRRAALCRCRQGRAGGEQRTTAAVILEVKSAPGNAIEGYCRSEPRISRLREAGD
uniref:Uncharacterized protein n=1 Tax=Arundo donax TaxID=35708 RepID=A0A0A9C651_ARUDO